MNGRKGKKMDLENYYDYLVDNNIASDEALKLVTCINGYNVETLNDVLYCLTGYREIKDYLIYNDKDTFKEYYIPDDVNDFI